MAEKIDINKGYLSNQVYSGVVQLAFPSLGWALVNPAGSTADKTILCRLPANGGILGAGTIAAPVTGTLVTYRRQKGTDKGYIVSVNPQGTQPDMPAQAVMLHNYPAMTAVSLTLTADNLAQFVQQITQGKQRATYIGGQEDQYQGDVYTGDRYGPGTFTGRAQITVKGSDLAYTEFSAIDDKITTVANKQCLYTLSDKQQLTTNLNKYLKAVSSFQGIGGRPWQKQDPIISFQGMEIRLKEDIADPLYRLQTFQGGAARGTSFSVISPLQKTPEAKPVILSDIKTLDGRQMQMSVQGQTSIKTANTVGLADFSFQQPLKTEQGKKQLQKKREVDKKLLEKLQKVKFSENGLQRTAQIDAVLNADARALLADMLGTEALQLLQYQVEPFNEPYGTVVQWTGDQQPKIEEMIGDYQTSSIQEQAQSATGLTSGPGGAQSQSGKRKITRFKNNSIITQDPDGTITLKDGWGSQITMSHGNIYISSALDTFIRPGRDLIAMVPQHLSATANGEIEVGAKKNIKIGSQKDLVLSSAISGQSGYTVLQNRTKNGDAGMVIRSNGKLTLTSSDDMHIGINDKRTSHKGYSATYGSGSIFIEGQKVRVESRDQLKLLGKYTGIYACGDDTGTGVQLSMQAATITTPVINANTGGVRVGQFQTNYTVSIGATGERTITLDSGSAGSGSVQVRGNLYVSADITCGSNLNISRRCLAEEYIILQTEPLEKIPGVKESSIRSFRAQLRRLFSSPFTAPVLTFAQNLQDWYGDYYICTRQLQFKDDWTVTKMPTMCWQLQSGAGQGEFRNMQSIESKPTGDLQKPTCAYPGTTGWDSGKMFTIEAQTFAAKYETSIRSGYKTYTKKEK